MYYIYGCRMRKKTWGGGQEVRSPPRCMWKEEDMNMAPVQLEYVVRFDCPPWKFSSSIKNFIKHTAVLERPCLRYESDMKSRTMQSGLRLEDAFFPKLCLNGLTWSHERTSLLLPHQYLCGSYALGLENIQNKNEVEWKRGIPLNM